MHIIMSYLRITISPVTVSLVAIVTEQHIIMSYLRIKSSAVVTMLLVAKELYIHTL